MLDPHPAPEGGAMDFLSAYPTLAAQALLYAGGELEGADAVAFEQLLAEDQTAREVLRQAVQWTHTLGGRPVPVPDLAYRARVRQHLMPTGGLWSCLAPRSYPGHPALWTILGAGLGLAATLLILVRGASPLPPAPEPVAQSGLPRTLPQESEPNTPIGLTAVPNAGALPVRQVAPEMEPATQALAVAWAELPNSNHLIRAHEEENRRRSRRLDEHRLGHGEDRFLRGRDHPTRKQD